FFFRDGNPVVNRVSPSPFFRGVLRTAHLTHLGYLGWHVNGLGDHCLLTPGASSATTTVGGDGWPAPSAPATRISTAVAMTTGFRLGHHHQHGDRGQQTPHVSLHQRSSHPKLKKPMPAIVERPHAPAEDFPNPAVLVGL